VIFLVHEINLPSMPSTVGTNKPVLTGVE